VLAWGWGLTIAIKAALMLVCLVLSFRTVPRTHWNVVPAFMCCMYLAVVTNNIMAGASASG